MEIVVIGLAGTAVIIAVIAGISMYLARHAAPDAADLEVLRAAPDEEVLDYRVCNALIKTAEPNVFFELALFGVGMDNAAGLGLKLMKKMMGGLWVGGRVFLTTDRIVFMPNGLNRAVQDGLEVVALRLPDLSGVVERFGVGTRIIDFRTKGGELSVRSARTRQFAAAVQDRLERLSGPAQASIPPASLTS